MSKNIISKSNLSKNIISKDGPTNDLERLVSNMHGSEYPVEPTFGLGKEIKKIDQNGSSSSGGVFFVTDNENTLDKTWAEISSASENGVVVLNLNNKLGYLIDVGHVEEDYGCAFMIADTNLHGDLVAAFRWYATSAENGYPIHE